MTKEHMFWSPDCAYKEGIPTPRVTYRCKASATKEGAPKGATHLCKKVTDHPGSCLCICDLEFNKEKSE